MSERRQPEPGASLPPLPARQPPIRAPPAAARDAGGIPPGQAQEAGQNGQRTARASP